MPKPRRTAEARGIAQAPAHGGSSTPERTRPGFVILRVGLGLVLAASALAKLAAPSGFAVILSLYGVPAPAYAAAVTIALELLVGAVLAGGWYPRTALGVAGALLTAYWAFTLFGPRLLMGCGCFGTLGPVLSLGQHVALLVVMTLGWVALLLHETRGRRGMPGAKPWSWPLIASVIVVTLATVAGGATLSRQEAAVPAQARNFRAIPVATLDGRTVLLDATRTPVLFFASWCPHCTQLLTQMAREPLPARPVLVSTFFRGPDTAANRDATLTQLRQAGLRLEDGWTLYLDVNRTDLVEAVPELAHMADGEWRIDKIPDVAALRAVLEGPR